MAKKREQKHLNQKLETLLAARQELLQRFSELQDKRFAVRQQVATMINTELSPSIRVSVVQYGNRDNFRKALEEALKGGGMKQAKVAEKLSAFWPGELAAVIQARDYDALVQKGELRRDQAEKVLVALSKDGEVFELEATELLDRARIELKCGDEYRESSVVSTGQKCTAILPIVLLDSVRPLIVDQPEDHLDNRFVYETVVSIIRSIKQRRQMLFASHNPNLVVLAESERVFMLDSDGTCAHLVVDGAMEECKLQVGDLLEGGEKPFRMRKERYGW